MNQDDEKLMLQAADLEAAGDWDAAIHIYARVAEQSPEHSRYAANCVSRLREYKAMVARAPNAPVEGWTLRGLWVLGLLALAVTGRLGSVHAPKPAAVPKFDFKDPALFREQWNLFPPVPQHAADQVDTYLKQMEDTFDGLENPTEKPNPPLPEFAPVDAANPHGSRTEGLAESEQMRRARAMLQRLQTEDGQDKEKAE